VVVTVEKVAIGVLEAWNEYGINVVVVVMGVLSLLTWLYKFVEFWINGFIVVVVVTWGIEIVVDVLTLTLIGYSIVWWNTAVGEVGVILFLFFILIVLLMLFILFISLRLLIVFKVGIEVESLILVLQLVNLLIFLLNFENLSILASFSKFCLLFKLLIEVLLW